MLRIAQLLRDQAAELARLAEGQASRVVSVLTDGAALLAARLRAVLGEGVERTRALLAQSIASLRALRAHLGLVFSDGVIRAQALLVRHLSELFGRMEPARGVPPLAESLGRVRDLELHLATVDRMAAQLAEQVQRAIVASVARKADVARAASEAMAKTAGRSATAGRTEANRAYNDAALTAIREMNLVDSRPDDPVLKRIEEIIDSRNHPFSRVADGQAVPVDELFRVSVVAVADMAASMGVRVSDIFWPQQGGFYVGDNLPAHFNERGRIVPWRSSWGP